MKKTVCVIYPDNFGAAWSACEGILDVLLRMGHSVSGIPCKGNRFPYKPQPETFEGADLILMTGFEWLKEDLQRYYSLDDWNKIKVPKAVWYHESMMRPDTTFPVEEYKSWADLHFFPSLWDANTYGGYHLPFGVDVEMFKPNEPEVKDDEAVFIGSVYGIRQEFIAKLEEYNGFVPFKTNQVFGRDGRDATKNYARQISKAPVFVNLPSLSQLYITKVFEVAACHTCLVTNLISTKVGGFEGYISNVFRYSKPSELCTILHDLKENPKKANEYADKAYAEVLLNHRLEYRLEEILKHV